MATSQPTARTTPRMQYLQNAFVERSGRLLATLSERRPVVKHGILIIAYRLLNNIPLHESRRQTINPRMRGTSRFLLPRGLGGPPTCTLPAMPQALRVSFDARCKEAEDRATRNDGVCIAFANGLLTKGRLHCFESTGSSTSEVKRHKAGLVITRVRGRPRRPPGAVYLLPRWCSGSSSPGHAGGAGFKTCALALPQCLHASCV